MFAQTQAFTSIELKSAIVREPLVVSPDTTVIDAIAQMSGGRSRCTATRCDSDSQNELHSDARSSCVLVVEEGRAIGILTERDIVRLSAQQQSLERLTMQQVMTHPLVGLRESAFTDLFLAITLLQQHRIRHLPILDDRDRLVGLLTHETLRQIFRPIDLLRLRLVAEVASRNTICAAPDSSMLEIAQRMAKHRVSSVVIVERVDSPTEPLQMPVGILTERDLVQFQALGLNLERYAAQSVMSAPLFTVKPEESLWTVQQMMEQRFIRRLVVTGERGELLGIVTPTSLLQALNPLALYDLAQVLDTKVKNLEAEKIALLESRTTELEQQVETRTAALKTRAEREKLVAQIAHRIRTSLHVQEVLDACVAEVRSFLDCDRVVVYQFQPDWSGMIIAESVDNGWLSALGNRIADSCFQQQTTSLFNSDAPIAINDIYAAGYADCHIQLLERYQVKANLVVPIRVGGQLWGLLLGHQCTDARTWQREDMTLLQEISVQLAIALQQATTCQQLLEELIARRQAEARLQESQQRYASLAAAVPVGIFRTDATGNCTYVNDRWCQIAGLTPEAAAGEGWQQALHPDDRPLIAAEWQQFTREHRPFQLEYRFWQSDGSIIWVFGQALAERDKDGNIVGYVGTITDISDRKQAEAALQQLNQTLEARVEARTQELQERETQLRDLFDNATDLIQSISPDGRILFVNKAWKETLGYNETDLEQLSIFQIIHPDELVHCQRAMQHLFTESATCLEIETRFLTKAGKEIIVEGNVNCQFKDGIPVATRGIFRDVTQRKQAEQDLRESQQFLQTVLDTFPLVVFWKNRESVYLGCNQNFANLRGLASPADIIGKTDYDLPWETREAALHRASDRQVMDSGTAKLGIIETQNWADGTTIWVESNKVPLRDLKGEIIGILGTYQDITARKIAEAALAESETFNRQLVEEFPIGLASCRMDGRFFYVNSAFAKILGYTVEECLELTYWDITPLKYAEQDAEQLKKSQIEGRYGPYEKEFIHRDGHLVPVLLTGLVILQNEEWSLWSSVQDISDRKQAEQTIHQQVEREKLLREITQRIRQSLDVQAIFDTACQEIRQVIQADRVAIFKFYPDSDFKEGEFVAESVVEGFSSVVAIRVQDHCFGENYSALYARGRFYTVDDIYQNGLGVCHTNILAQFEVRANLVMPLLCGDVLWGLLCVHQSTARHWQQSEIDFTQQLSNQLAIAIQQASLYDRIQSELRVRQQAEAKIALQLRQQQALETIAQHIRESLDIDRVLATVTQQVKEVLNGDRVIVFRLFPDGNSQIVKEAVSPEFSPLDRRYWHGEKWSQDILDYYWQGKPRIVPDVMNDMWSNCLTEYSREGQIQSKIVAPILQEVRESEKHRWVAPWENHKLWGILVIHACREKRVWQESEAQILQQVANQLAIAIQQTNLFEQLQQELTERQQAQQQLTERNQQLAVSNEELARATRLKDEFLANMSHELRTPLNAILGMTEGLQEEVFGAIGPEQNKALQTIERSGSHLLELINDILDVAKIESGQMELDCAPTAIAPLCQSSLAFVKQQALKKGLQLDLKLPVHLPEICIDERRIRQVLINLLNNAVKFTPSRGRITLEVSYQQRSAVPDAIHALPHSLRVAVSDTGIGIAPEHIDKLFQPFIQIDSALNRQYTGTGLGLALVKRIVELHGGQVELTSQVGVGSCFAIDLPCLASPQWSSEPEFQPEPILEAGRSALEASPLILLAEDNEANISTVSSYLKAKGYRLILAKNGREAIALTQSEAPDLILMDIQMPGMDGLEAIRQIRREPNLEEIPIIALTALAMSGDRERCLEAGANDYLTKPVKLKLLTVAIQQLLTPLSR